MNPELLTLLALASDPIEEPSQGRDLTEWSEQYNLEAKSVTSPKIDEVQCHVDLGEYPNVHLMWPNKGPQVDPNEEAILVGERNFDTGGVYPSGSLVDFTTELALFNRQVDVVLAIDTSGSMEDNARLTEQVKAQIERYYPNSQVHIDTIYYNESGVTGNRAGNRGSSLRNYGYGNYSGEEDHIGALNEGLRMLNAEDGPNHEQHIILVTDEGDKRSSDHERKVTSSKARNEGVRIHLLYDGPEPIKKVQEKPKSYEQYDYNRHLGDSSTRTRSSRFSEDFTSLRAVARSTGGEVRRLEGGRVPSIFRTQIKTEDFSSITIVPAEPYQQGQREFVVANDEGATCTVNIPESVIEAAISEGRLPEPTTTEEHKEAKESDWNIPSFTTRDGIIFALGGALGSIVTWLRTKSKNKRL